MAWVQSLVWELRLHIKLLHAATKKTPRTEGLSPNLSLGWVTVPRMWVQVPSELCGFNSIFKKKKKILGVPIVVKRKRI